MSKQDLTPYGDNELSLWVFNDEFLYRQRFSSDLLDLLDELFVFTEEQKAKLLEDLAADLGGIGKE